MTVVAQTEDGLGAVRLVECLAPDVLLLGVGLPDLDGVEVLERLRHRGSHTKALVVTMHRGIGILRSGCTPARAGTSPRAR
ncbi:response regulator [Candidatus Poribacteria bacterium]|jgi:DNA-binding NarL/FixJ family response regulator|nr:response regulator [Candidatus Poribacteria bacterium]MBT5532131.1 response regulator [Candidatus Poribacteria bacterium]MBT5711701.1 response regulator [Candidatus Poribacteria bacterium]MBT7098592.1 response regulator [Candidatus Poribacteria bacterium]MBT7807772.1 response regulator [Candidatus Poribacteria bacterium]